MKNCIRALLCAFSVLVVDAQEITDAQNDSIYDILRQAYTLSDQGEYGESIKMTKEVITLLDTSENFSLLGTANTVLAYAYSGLRDKEKTFEYAIKSRDYYIKTKDTSNIISAYSDMGVTYEDFEMYDKAYESYKKAVFLSEKFKDKDTVAMIFANMNIGGVLVGHMNEYEEGLKHLKKVELILSKKIDSEDYISTLCTVYPNIGYAYYKLEKFKESDEYYDKALKLANKEGYLPIMEGIYADRSNLYRGSGKLEKAIEMMDGYNTIHDSINTAKNMELAKTIEAKYRVKESEEKLLFLEKEQAAKEAQLKRSYTYNTLLGLLSFLLLLAGYWIFNRSKKLKVAKDIAENLSRVQSDFYSEISHELRTPLYGVIELSNILLKDSVNDKNREYLESLKFSGNHLLSLVNNVLELNKIESGKLAVEQIEFNLKILITNLIDSLEYALRDSNNEIKLNYDESISNKLIGDSLKLSQLLINLVSNAIKFTKNGIIEIEISKVKSKDGKEEISFAVKDNGMGIPKDKQKNIFEDFYQERSRQDNPYKGTGLGLSIVKRLLSKMGSSIRVESELNKGTAFYFNLTFDEVLETKQAKPRVESKLLTLKQMRFLVVDDNKINQLVTRKLLQQLELECDVVENGLEAIEAAKEKKYHCILMDIHMPKMNGYEATQRIRRFDQDIVIIALTATTSEEVKNNISFCDMDDYILKPFYSEDFINTIENAIVNRADINRETA